MINYLKLFRRQHTFRYHQSDFTKVSQQPLSNLSFWNGKKILDLHQFAIAEIDLAY